MLRNLLGTLWRPAKEAWLRERAEGGLLASFGPPPPRPLAIVLPLRPLKLASIVPQPFSRVPTANTTPLLNALHSMFPALASRFTTTAGYTAAARPMMATTARAYTTRPVMSFRSAPPFGRAFPSNGGAGAFSRSAGSRNYTTGFQRVYDQGGQQAFNAFAGFKVLPGAVADERFACRDGKSKRATATAGKTTGSAASSRRPARLSTRRAHQAKPGDFAAVGDAKKAAASEIVSVAPAVAVVTAPAAGAIRKRACRDLSKLPASIEQCQESVTLSIFLYGPPAWEMDTVHPGATTRISPALISELRTLAAIHRDHLTSVAATLETLLAHGFGDVSVVEDDDNGVYELVVRFPAGFGRDRVVDCLIVMGIDPCSESFRMECHRFTEKVEDAEADVSNMAQLVEPPAADTMRYDYAVDNRICNATASASGSGSDVGGFPWRRAHSPSQGSLGLLTPADPAAPPPSSANDFLRMLDEMQGARMSFSA
ncbi:hypothetical protein HDU90_001253 [Geranomyces variabilis]|nr:hypothetical protein HDU90_001253 [Geranomyces variabilis]